MGAQVLYTLSVSHSEGCGLTHHQVYHDTLSFRMVTALHGVHQEGGLIHHEDLSISIRHGGTTHLYSNQLVYSTGDSMGTVLTSKCNVEQGNPIRDQLHGSSPGIVPEQVNNVGEELKFGVFACSRGWGHGSVVDSHLEDEHIIRLLLVPSQIAKDIGNIICAGQIQET